MLAQDLAASYGKVMRLRPDGSAPPDNPFVGEPGAIEGIWSFGHRNVQGAAIHPGSGALWTVEHGPKGGDELNLPGPGLNFGWPEVSYGATTTARRSARGVALGARLRGAGLLLGPGDRAGRHGLLSAASCSRTGRATC